MHNHIKKLVIVILIMVLSILLTNLSFAFGLNDVENGYFRDYPADEGYANVGEAFPRFFSHTKWVTVTNNEGVTVPGFKGIAQIDGNNAKFEIYFVMHDGYVFINEVYVNGERCFFRPVKMMPNMASLLGYNTLNDNDLLAAIYLN